MKQASIHAIEYYLPERELDNEELAKQFPEWSAAQIFKKTGIRSRRIAADGETSSDMAVKAAERLFDTGRVLASDIDFVILCTQSPDYFLPSSACLVQQRLGLSTRCGALDINLGCSGFVYSLSLCKGLIETGAAKNVLLLTSETYSKFMDPKDKNVRTLFGDGAAATLVHATEGDAEIPFWIGPFVFGTDGSGSGDLILACGGLRMRRPNGAADVFLRMNGPSIFSFTLKRVPGAVRELLEKAGMQMEDVESFVFHQANGFMLEALRKDLGIPVERFMVDIENVGNTVSSTIPIVLARSMRRGTPWTGAPCMLVGFGVGLSWAACMIRLPPVA